MAASGILGQGYTTTIYHFAVMKCSRCTFGSKGKGKIVGYKNFMGPHFQLGDLLGSYQAKSDATAAYPVFSISKPLGLKNKCNHCEEG